MNKKFINVVLTLFVFIFGLSLFLWSDKVTNLMSIIFGILLIIYGLLNSYVYIKSKNKRIINISTSVISLVIGIILVAKPTIVSEIISFIIGGYIVLSSLNLLLDALELKNNNIIIGLSIVGIIIGIFCILGKILIPNILLSMIGLLLMIYCVIYVIDSILMKN